MMRNETKKRLDTEMMIPEQKDAENGNKTGTEDVL